MLALLPVLGALAVGAPAQAGEPSVLVYTRTTGFRHESIPAAVAAVREEAANAGLKVSVTEDPGAFTDRRLKRHTAVLFLLTSGEVLARPQEEALRRFVTRGGGFAGVHSASDSERGWSFYPRLIGARQRSHPATQPGAVDVADANHASTRPLPTRWERTDEFYDFETNPRPRVRVLATLDESSYQGGLMGADHPIVWADRARKGRTWYTALGHTTESYADPVFRAHLIGGIRSVLRR